MGEINADVAAPAAAHQQQAKADKLADDGGPCRAGNSQIKHKDQQRVQTDIQYCADSDAHHGIGGAALKAELIVQHQRGGHPRRTQQNHTEIRLGVGQNRIRGAQQIGQRLQENQAQRTDEHARRQRRKEACGGHVRSLLIIFLANGAGHEIAAALPEEKADGLYDRHQGKHHAHSAGGGIAFQHSHEKGVRHIVKCRDQHTDDTG